MSKHKFEMIIEIEIEGAINQQKFFGFIKSIRHRLSSRYKSIQITNSKLLIRPSQIEYPTDKTVK
jgi:hypothetical protein